MAGLVIPLTKKGKAGKKISLKKGGQKLGERQGRRAIPANNEVYAIWRAANCHSG
jgi:hypothetical protein